MTNKDDCNFFYISTFFNFNTGKQSYKDNGSDDDDDCVVTIKYTEQKRNINLKVY